MCPLIALLAARASFLNVLTALHRQGQRPAATSHCCADNVSVANLAVLRRLTQGGVQPHASMTKKL